MKKTFRLSERELKNMIAESVRRALNEAEGDEVEMLWDELRNAKGQGANVHEILSILKRLESALRALPDDDERALTTDTTYQRRPSTLGNPDQPKTWQIDHNFRNEKGKYNPFGKRG
jgi:hypothetical protein